MSLYPITLRGSRIRAVVVGGGAVGTRKANALLQAGAAVRVVDPNPADVPAGAELVQESYCPEHVEGATLIMACTNDPDVNERVLCDARERGILAQRADDGAAGDFILPAAARDGDVVLAVAAEKAGPSFAAMVRDMLSDSLPDDLSAFAEAIGEIRARVCSSLPEPRRGVVMRRLASEEGLRVFRAQGAAGLADLADRAS